MTGNNVRPDLALSAARKPVGVKRHAAMKQPMRLKLAMLILLASVEALK